VFQAEISSGIAGIWEGTPGNVAIVAQALRHAPGTPTGIIFFNNLTMTASNDSGAVAFDAHLSGPVMATNNEGIWAGLPGAIHLVARAGDPAPGFPAGYTFGTNINQGQQLFGTPLINDAGQVAFEGTVISPNLLVTQAIWATDRNGNLQLIMKGNENDGGLGFGLTGLDALGQIEILDEGTDAILISNAVAVPEPATILLAVTAPLWIVAHRLRRRNDALTVR